MKAYSFDSDDVYYFNTHRSKELVLALQNRYSGFDDSIVPSLVERALACKVHKIVRNSNFGTGHIIYIVDTDRGDVVFRGNRFLEIPEHYMQLEQIITETYKAVGIPVNSMLFSDTSRALVPFDYQIMELLPGKDLEDDFNGTKEDYDTISYRLGQLVALQYKAPVAGWGRFKNTDELIGVKNSAHEFLMAYVDHDLEEMVKGGLITDEGYTEIMSFLVGTKPILDKLGQAHLLNHDIADHNIRYEGNRVVALFDWENAVAFDPLCEIGSAHTWVCHYPRREQMTRGFLDALGFIPEDFEARVSLYFLRTMLWKSAFALRGERFSERHYGLLREALDETVPDVNTKMT